MVMVSDKVEKIKRVRSVTSLGLRECKWLLQTNDWDIDKALGAREIASIYLSLQKLNFEKMLLLERVLDEFGEIAPDDPDHELKRKVIDDIYQHLHGESF